MHNVLNLLSPSIPLIKGEAKGRGIKGFIIIIFFFFIFFGCNSSPSQPSTDCDSDTDYDTDTEALEVPEVPDTDYDSDATTDTDTDYSSPLTDHDIDNVCLDLRISENVIKTPFPFKDKNGRATFCRPGCDTPTETDPQCVRNIWEWDNWSEYQVYLAAEKKDPNQTLERECYPWPCKLPDMKAKTQKEIKTLVSKCDRWLTVNEFEANPGIIWSHGMSSGVAGMDWGHTGRLIEYDPEKDDYSTIAQSLGDVSFNENRYIVFAFDRRAQDYSTHKSFVISVLRKNEKYYYELIYDNEKHNAFSSRPPFAGEKWVLIQVRDGKADDVTEVKYAKAGVWEWQTISGIDYHHAQEGNIVGDHLTFITNNRDMYYCDLRTAPKHIGNCFHINRSIEDGEFEQGHEPRIDVENEYRLVYNIDNSKIFVEVNLSDDNNPIYTEHLITPSDETTWAVSPNMLRGNIVSYTEAFQIFHESWQADFKGCFYRFDTKKSYCSNPVFEQTPGYANVSLMGYNVFWGKWHLWKMIGRTAALMRDWECYCEETGICPLVEEVKTKKTPSRPAHNHPSFYDINNSRMLTPPPILSSTAVRYCASSYRWIQDRGKWSEQGYCTTEIDDFSKASIKNWEQRITVADSVGQIGGGNGSHQLLITTIGGKEVLWNWRADWYKENCCLDNPTREICKSIKNGGDYNKEFTMYYTLSTAVLPVMKSMPLSKIPPYSVENEECAPMDAAYFSSY